MFKSTKDDLNLVWFDVLRLLIFAINQVVTVQSVPKFCQRGTTGRRTFEFRFAIFLGRIIFLFPSVYTVRFKNVRLSIFLLLKFSNTVKIAMEAIEQGV